MVTNGPRIQWFNPVSHFVVCYEPGSALPGPPVGRSPSAEPEGNAILVPSGQQDLGHGPASLSLCCARDPEVPVCGRGQKRADSLAGEWQGQSGPHPKAPAPWKGR